MKNTVDLIGYAGSDPEMRYTPNGNAVVNFNLAVNRKYTSQGEQKTETDWFSVTAWNKLAESCNNYVHRGMMVNVIGRVKLEEWQAQDGSQRAKMAVIASSVIFLKDAMTKQQPPQQGYQQPAQPQQGYQDSPW